MLKELKKFSKTSGFKQMVFVLSILLYLLFFSRPYVFIIALSFLLFYYRSFFTSKEFLYIFYHFRHSLSRTYRSFIKYSSKTTSLTEQQEEIFKKYQLSFCRSKFNIALGFKIVGRLDEKRLKESIKEAVFFTNINSNIKKVKNNLYKQVLTNDKSFFLEYIDITNEKKTFFNEDENNTREKRAIDMLKEKLTETYDLEKDRFFSTILLRYEKNNYLFMLLCSHIFCDLKSGLLFINTVSESYNNPIISALKYRLYKTINYKHCAFDAVLEYQKYWKKYYTQEQKIHDIKYWIEVLRGSELHFDFKWPDDSDSEGPNGNVNGNSSDTTTDTSRLGEVSRIYFEIGGEYYEKLQKYIETIGKSNFVVLSAFFNAFLYRIFKEKEASIIVAYPVDLRPEGYDLMTGMYQNKLYLKSTLNENTQIGDLIIQIDETLDKNQKHKYLNYSDLFIEIRKIDSNVDETTVNVAMEETIFSKSMKFKRSESEAFVLQNRVEVTTDLTFYYQVSETDKKVYLAFDYVNCVFDREYLKRLTTNFVIFIEEILDNQYKPLSKQHILSYREYYKQIIEWNRHNKKRSRSFSQAFYESIPDKK